MTTPNPAEVLLDVEQVGRYSGPPLLLFIGVSTSGSSVHAAFPAWAPIFAPDAVLRGVDVPEDADPSRFVQLVSAMRDNPRVHGAVITSHKLRIYRACASILDAADPLVEITHEINSLDTRDSQVKGFARDAQSLDLILDTVGGDAARRQRPYMCIGAGGSAIALMLAMGLDIAATIDRGVPTTRRGGTARGPLTVMGRRQEALDELDAVRRRAGIPDGQVDLVLAPSAAEVSARTRSCSPGTVIANATGLGKLGPGSPVTGPDAFPQDALAWDFNYRGPLDFLQQASAAGAQTEDGWDYFVAGWMAALAAVVGRSIDADLVDAMRGASEGLRP